MSHPQFEQLATNEQAAELLAQINAVTTRGEALMDRFFFVGKTDTIPQSVADIFPPVESLHEKCEYVYLFAHVYTPTAEPVTHGLAGLLSLSRLEYKGEQVFYDSSAIYRVMANDGQYNIEQEISYDGPHAPTPIFRTDDAEAIAREQDRLAFEAEAKRVSYETERALGLLTVSYAVADEVIAFARQHNPHLPRP